MNHQSYRTFTWQRKFFRWSRNRVIGCSLTCAAMIQSDFTKFKLLCERKNFRDNLVSAAALQPQIKSNYFQMLHAHSVKFYIFVNFDGPKSIKFGKLSTKWLISQLHHKFREILHVKFAYSALREANAVVCEANSSNSSTHTAARVSAISFSFKTGHIASTRFS